LITDPFIPTAANVAALAGVRLDQGHHKDGLKTARSALELAVQTEDPFAEMEAWGWIGYALDETGPVGDCLEAYERAIALSRELEELPSESITQARLGMILWKTGEFEASRPHFETAVELAEKIGDPYYLGLAQGDLGHYFMDKEDSSLNDLNRAIECYQTALDIHRSAGVRRGEGFWLGQLGRTRIKLEDFVTAKAWLEEAIQIHLEVGDLTAIPRHLQYLAQLHLRKPDDTLAAQATAVAYYKVAIERLNERGSSIEMQNIRNELEAFLNAKSRETRDDLIVRAQVIQNVIIQYLDYQKGSLP
jgi:tetratricopeptide (TPR) repeat protein